jgi:hypothetical protein
MPPRWPISSLSTTSRPETASIGLPEGWSDRTVVTYVGPDDGGGSPSLVLTRDPLGEDVSLGRYAAMQDGALRAGFEGVELLDDREAEVAGRPAVVRTYRWTLDGHTMRQRVWCMVEGGTGYAIVASAPDAIFDGLRSTFAAAVREFRIG